ncbi:Tim44/TimA family putative adaptor protein [Sphingomonas montanisoli]|uniref:Tim44 domain-containing protein n=1 Tax=Sphingomonas montanisoli TaxID=2606412 RepID=A0A5D9C8X2_9SPHN|nr:Tim44/TimA family putative adaptor protein [Sphingomonas montanisoli]TZG27843.1 Tim44 domain-containing protein [Sphingomonas montanisoli]
MATIVILAMVFLFVAFRLWSVLGRRTGHEQTIARPAEATPAPIAAGRSLPDTTAPIAPGRPALVEPRAETGLRAIQSVESHFDAAQFVEGARSAYRMILEAYWEEDLDTLRNLTGDSVYDAFADAIAQRKDAGQKLDNRLVTIESAVIEAASLSGRQASITVRFEADIAAVTRDAEDHVIAGSLTDAVPTHDVWTFAREVKSDDPNWVLIETDEAA